ncbi:MAG: hypothetical protein V8T45_09280 [Oscillospiraceae bacterium]
MSLLAVLDNPHQDVPLIAVLRSGAFTPDELTEIRSADRKGDFYTALKAAGEHSEKCRDFLELLEQLRDLAADMSMAELSWLLLDRLDSGSVQRHGGRGAEAGAAYGLHNPGGTL